MASNLPSQQGPKRRSQRVLMQVPIRLRGADAQGRSFDEQTETLAVSAHGALVLLQTRVTSGTAIRVQHKKTLEEQECHVVFLGPVRGDRAEIGLEFSAPRPQFWRVAFPPEDWSPKNPESRTAASQRPPQK
jgi:PilZ domain